MHNIAIVLLSISWKDHITNDYVLNLSKVDGKTEPLKRPDYSTVQIIRSQ